MVAYLHLLTHNPQLARVHFSRADFVHVHRSVAKRYWGDTPQDARRAVERVRRVMSDMEIILVSDEKRGGDEVDGDQSRSGRHGTTSLELTTNITTPTILTAHEYASLAAALRYDTLGGPFTPQRAKALFAEMDDRGIPVHTRVINLVLDGLGKSVPPMTADVVRSENGLDTLNSPMVEAARETWKYAGELVDEEMVKRKIFPDVVTLTALLDLAGRTVLTPSSSLCNGDTVKYSDSDPIPANLSSWPRRDTTKELSSTSSFKHPLQPDTFLRLFRTLFPFHHVSPNVFSYTVVISHLARAGKLRWAAALLNEAVEDHRVGQLTEGPFATLVGALVKKVQEVVASGDGGTTRFDPLGGGKDPKLHRLSQLQTWACDLVHRSIAAHVMPNPGMVGDWMSVMYPEGLLEAPPVSNNQSPFPLIYIPLAAQFNPGTRFSPPPPPPGAFHIPFSHLVSSVAESSRILRQLRRRLEIGRERNPNKELSSGFLQFTAVQRHLGGLAAIAGLSGKAVVFTAAGNVPRRTNKVGEALGLQDTGTDLTLDVVREFDDWHHFFTTFGYDTKRNRIFKDIRRSQMSDEGERCERSSRDQFAALRVYTLSAIGDVEAAEKVLWQSTDSMISGPPDWMSLIYVMDGYSARGRREDVIRVFERAYWGWRGRTVDVMSGRRGTIALNFPFGLYLTALFGEGQWARKVELLRTETHNQEELAVGNEDGDGVTTSSWRRDIVPGDVTAETVQRSMKLLDDTESTERGGIFGPLTPTDKMQIAGALWHEGSILSQKRALQIIAEFPVFSSLPQYAETLKERGTEGTKLAISDNLLLRALAKTGQIESSLDVAEALARLGPQLPISPSAFSTMLRTVASNGTPEQHLRALRIVDSVRRCGMSIGTAGYHSAMRMYSALNDLPGAEALLDSMLAEGVKPHIGTFVTLLDMLSKGKEVTRMEALFSVIANMGIEVVPQTSVWAAVADCYSRVGLWSNVLGVWNTVRQFAARGVIPINIGMVCVVLDALGHTGRSTELDVVWEEVVAEAPHTLKSENVWNSRVEALLRIGQIERARCCIQEEMVTYGIPPSSKTIGTFSFPLLGRLWSQDAANVLKNFLLWCRKNGHEEQLTALVEEVNRPLIMERLQKVLASLEGNRYGQTHRLGRWKN
ncbi:hypothetical protein HDU93_000067 [Gonapodya sp. JEL0774]|nr:hypothetical protein HDU93_000067 [Gonapodya sp. JEL0774]